MSLNRRFLGRRQLGSRALLAALALASASLGACGDNHGEDSADLQAILHDGDLTQVARSMLGEATDTGTAGTGGPTASTGGASGPGGAGGVGGPGGAGGRGGAIATGGVTASGGRMGTGGQGPTGSGGIGTGGKGMGGIGPVPRNFPRTAQGFWRFDDCRMDRTELGDSTFGGNHTAYRSVTTFCRAGVANSGVGFDEDDDLVMVPDQPNFVFSEGFTVAA